MYNKKHLSKRPFLLINNTFRPVPGTKTSTPGWTETAGWSVSEEVVIVDRITTKHQTYATLIVDILEAKCIKNSFQNSSKEEATAHFMDKYKEQIKEAVGVWLEREAQRLASSRVVGLDESHNAVNESPSISTETI